MAPNDHEPTVEVDDEGTIHLGAHAIPLPASISPAAREWLKAIPRRPALAYPAPEDKAAWRELVRQVDAAFMAKVEACDAMIGDRATVEAIDVGGVTVQVATPAVMSDAMRGRAMLAVHEGGFMYLGGPWVRVEAALTAIEWGCVAYSVDYRMPPDHPYPAPVDDVVAAYRDVLERHAPRDVVLSGVSAGATLVPAATLKARDAGLPLPAALIMNSGPLDFTESGDTYHTLRQIDPRLRKPLGAAPIAVYADGHDLTDPYLSPLFGDFSLGFPPTYLQSGTRDILLSDMVRMHRKLRRAGIDAELHVWEAGIHGGFGWQSGGSDALPEAVEEHEEQARFLARHWGVG